MEKIILDLGPRSYPVCLGNDLSGQFPAFLQDRFPGSRFALVTNSTLAALYAPTIERWEKELSLVKILIPDGEKYKSLSTWESIIDALLGVRLDRKSVVLAFGGGVVGDITGFAAACYLRGVAYVQIPTTLLAMVDSSVGGKTGVNHPSGKNLIGAFHQPALVWADTDYLNTLPSREYVAGYAELFKYAFIGEEEMFSFMATRHGDMMTRKKDALIEGIKKSISIKADVVRRDEREESGDRAMLNFGHTFAHSLERFFRFSGILHGEAVLWGIACACDLGMRVGSVPEGALGDYASLLKKLPRVTLPGKPDIEKIYEGMLTDKKNAQGKIHFILPAQPGFSVMKTDVPRENVLATLEKVLNAPLVFPP
jgi:3-dehydroquinate synthase